MLISLKQRVGVIIWMGDYQTKTRPLQIDKTHTHTQSSTTHRSHSAKRLDNTDNTGPKTDSHYWSDATTRPERSWASWNSVIAGLISATFWNVLNTNTQPPPPSIVNIWGLRRQPNVKTQKITFEVLQCYGCLDRIYFSVAQGSIFCDNTPKSGLSSQVNTEEMIYGSITVFISKLVIWISIVCIGSFLFPSPQCNINISADTSDVPVKFLDPRSWSKSLQNHWFFLCYLRLIFLIQVQSRSRASLCHWDCKVPWGKFVICETGLNRSNLIWFHLVSPQKKKKADSPESRSFLFSL